MPLPPCGGGRVGGGAAPEYRTARALLPPTLTLPRKGGGECASVHPAFPSSLREDPPLPDDLEIRIAESWRANAPAWTEAVRAGRIPSRVAGTDAAIIAAIGRAAPRNLVDIGCGEGWLARALEADKIRVTGIDASPELIAAARALGGGQFETMSYDALGAAAASLGAPFDLAVCNFALLGADVAAVLRGVHALLRPGGALLIQTVHPRIACGDGPYEDGWRLETFAAFGGAFPEAMPWYFRTLGSWDAAIDAGGFIIAERSEPRDEAGRTLSLLLRCSRKESSP
ncbi:MAG: class I SAM-dependent methyltransferase [Alphaproteobacteria bacterium]|nr:class I SAM-dependent methyltransferase [Alphaproteobacteria bacterium]